jgi:hypothetical protein
VLEDLGLLADVKDGELKVLTKEGRKFLEKELKREMEP